ncbi:MAG: enoyl-CoA hydratase/isomerase family protein, partial [Psychrobacter sp.]
MTVVISTADNKQAVTVSTAQKSPVLFSTESTDCGHLIGVMTLNTPKSLNALSVDMCKLLSQQLDAWASDARIVALVLKGAGDKAFCAGGDIRKLYDSMSTSAPLPNPYATEFFSHEYSLYRQMHFYAKPIILWGDGIIMGGGMGLMAACSHRLVTERTRFAMPEVTIGLFPDASGSWFLQNMPAKTGLFLGLTGAMCNG